MGIADEHEQPERTSSLPGLRAFALALRVVYIEYTPPMQSFGGDPR